MEQSKDFILLTKVDRNEHLLIRISNINTIEEKRDKTTVWLIKRVDETIGYGVEERAEEIYKLIKQA